MIACLPELYATYNRSDTDVTLLGPGAESRAWGAAGQGIAGVTELLTVIYQGWKR